MAGLETSGPAEETANGAMVLEGKPYELRRGDVVRVQQASGGVLDPVGLKAPAQERGTPRGEKVRPTQAHNDPDHTQPHHSAMLEVRCWKLDISNF